MRPGGGWKVVQPWGRTASVSPRVNRTTTWPSTSLAGIHPQNRRQGLKEMDIHASSQRRFSQQPKCGAAPVSVADDGPTNCGPCPRGIYSA